jgi:hypothetical protein
LAESQVQRNSPNATTRATPSRNEVTAAIRTVHFQGIAYPRQIEWDAQGDNIAALTALYPVTDDKFRQIAEIRRFGEA